MLLAIHTEDKSVTTPLLVNSSVPVCPALTIRRVG